MSIFLDVTELFGLELTSGIQRVVREVVRRSNHATHGETINMVPVVAVDGRFHRVDRSGLAPPTKRSVTPSPIGTRRPGPMNGLKAIIRRLPSLQRHIQRRRFEAGLRRKGGYDATPLIPGVGDQVVLLDSFWSGSSAIEAAARAKSAGATIIAVVYDLIPIHHPDQVPQSVALGFRHYIYRALALADGVVTISRQTTRDVIEALPIRSERIQHFYLGHDFTGMASSPSSCLSLLPDEIWRDRKSVV